MKKLFLLLTLLIPIVLFAQMADSTKAFSMGGAAGTISINGVNYSEIRLMPELGFGKFGIGLDVDLLIDEDGNIRKKDWDDPEDYINKIYYVRFGHRGDPFFAKIGGFPNYTLGHGLIMKNYSNMLKYPDEKHIGVQLGGILPFFSTNLEVFSSDISKNNILGGRVTAKFLSSTEIPILKNLTFGGTYVTDRNQFGGISDEDGDGYPDVFDAFPNNKNLYVDTDGDGIPDVDINGNYIDADLNNNNIIDYNWAHTHYDSSFVNAGEQFGYWDHNAISKRLHKYDENDPISIAGVDYELPLVSGDMFKLSNYGEIAKIMDHSYGFIFPGFYSKFLIFDMNLEFRHYDDDFVPSFFDNLYDENRAIVMGDTILTKESFIKNSKKSTGWYGSITSNLFNTLFLTVSYQDMYGTDIENGKSIWATTYLKKNMIPKLQVAQLSYSQTDMKNVLKDFKTPSTLIDGRLGYGLSSNTVLVYNFKERFIDFDGNNKINGKKETIKTFGFGVEFKF